MSARIAFVFAVVPHVENSGCNSRTNAESTGSWLRNALIAGHPNELPMSDS